MSEGLTDRELRRRIALSCVDAAERAASARNAAATLDHYRSLLREAGEVLGRTERALVDLGACEATDCDPPCETALAKSRALLSRINEALGEG